MHEPLINTERQGFYDISTTLNRYKIEIIKKVVADYYNYDKTIWEKTLNRKKLKIKQVAVYTCKQKLKVSLQELADIFYPERKNHCCIIHCVKVINDALFWDKNIQKEIKEIQKEIESILSSIYGIPDDTGISNFDTLIIKAIKIDEKKSIVFHGFTATEVEAYSNILINQYN